MLHTDSAVDELEIIDSNITLEAVSNDPNKAKPELLLITDIHLRLTKVNAQQLPDWGNQEPIIQS